MERHTVTLEHANILATWVTLKNCSDRGSAILFS
jgi:hypothetical protein